MVVAVQLVFSKYGLANGFANRRYVHGSEKFEVECLGVM